MKMITRSGSQMMASNDFLSEFNYMEHLFTLKLRASHVNYDDINSVENGALEFGLVYFPPVIFLLFNIHNGGFDAPSQYNGDAPFTIHLVPEAKRTIPSEGEKLGKLAVLLLERGELKAQRGIGLKETFIEIFRTWATRQLQSKFDQAKYDGTINEVYAKYTTDVLFACSPIRAVIPKR